MAITVPKLKVRRLNVLVDRDMSEISANAEFSYSMFQMRLVNFSKRSQLLTLARIDSGADSSRTERVELSSLTQEVVVDGNLEAEAKYCSVKVDSMDVCTTTGQGNNCVERLRTWYGTPSGILSPAPTWRSRYGSNVFPRFPGP
jgi:hypothetical protein